MSTGAPEHVRVKEWVVAREGAVATLTFDFVEKPMHEYLEHHISFALALESVRWDDTVRVVVIGGGDDGLFELGPPPGMAPEELQAYPPEVMDPAIRPGGPGALRGPWSIGQGISRSFEALALIDKPVVARVNGDAYGFALHLLWGCDVVVAREDAKLTDYHLTLSNELPYGMSAGDGAFAFMPLFLPPTLLKEFLLLGPVWTARDFADLRMINYAVPADELFARTEEIVQKFLARPARALARTKRAAQKRLLEQMNLTLDYAWLAESTDLWEAPHFDWKPNTSLHPDHPTWTVTDSAPNKYTSGQSS